MRAGVAIFLTFFGLYMLSGSRERPWGDANPVYEVAENLVRRGGVDVSVRWPVDLPPGRDGKYYAINPLLPSLTHVPAVAARELYLKLTPKNAALSLPIAAHVAPAALGALTCVLFFGLARRFGSPRAATWATIVLGVGTMVWVYARYPYTEILQAACFTGCALALVRALDDPSPSSARWLGLAAGLLVSSKLVYFVAIPGAALVVAWRLRERPRELLTFFAWTAATFAPWIVLLLFYNWLRFGSLLSSGYGEVVPGSGWIGLFGLLLSPGKSVLLYSPPLVVALFGVPALWRAHRLALLAFLGALVPVVVLYARFLFWAGDYAWGPRYLTFAIPVLLLPLVPVLDRLRGRRAALLLAPTLAAGIAVQLLGNAFYWDHWIRISKEVSAAWLGKPDRRGSTPRDRGGICDACFEDLYAQQWLPPFSPIAGHAWLLRHVPGGDDWKTAQADAPWRVYTRLEVKIDEQWYKRARLDWWPMDWPRKDAAALMGLVLALPLLAGAWLWRRALRSPEPMAPSIAP
jgi:hypothetical protein